MAARSLSVLDPLVRLHGVDENAVADIAPILGFLRDLQRRLEPVILLVHHSRKSGATRSGQPLRGSSEPHALGDSNLYLRRRHKQIVMTVEHRAAPGLNDIAIHPHGGNASTLNTDWVDTQHKAASAITLGFG